MPEHGPGEQQPRLAEALEALSTESRNPRTRTLDSMSQLELLEVMNREDARVAEAVLAVLPAVSHAVDLVSRALEGGGRLVYMGAGTSGRLGLLDAVECPPTFGTAPDQVRGLMAGGASAFVTAAEGAEDDSGAGAEDVRTAAVDERDVAVGLSASGRTPYVLGALAEARRRGAATVGVACNPGSAVGAAADVAIEPDTGPEVLTGSTRLKAGTAQKLVCNMLTTATMVRLGKVYENLMVDMVPTNAKLVDRSRRIVQEATGCSDAEVEAAMRAADGRVKEAVVMLLRGCDAEEAKRRLRAGGSRVRDALG